MTSILLHCKADPEARDPYGHQPLHIAAHRGSIGTINLLLARNAQVNAFSRERTTALHHAAARGCARTVACLLSAKADPTLYNAQGETAADCATDDRLRAILQRKVTRSGLLYLRDNSVPTSDIAGMCRTFVSLTPSWPNMLSSYELFEDDLPLKALLGVRNVIAPLTKLHTSFRLLRQQPHKIH